MEKNKDPIMEGIESGRIYGMKCASLKDSFDNLKFCPEREECIVLAEHMVCVNEMEDLVRDMYCSFCKSEAWLFIGITKDGIMVTATTSEEHAKKINNLIENKRCEENDKMSIK